MSQLTSVATRTAASSSAAPTDPAGPTGRLSQWLADFRLDQASILGGRHDAATARLQGER